MNSSFDLPDLATNPQVNLNHRLLVGGLSRERALAVGVLTVAVMVGWLWAMIWAVHGSAGFVLPALSTIPPAIALTIVMVARGAWPLDEVAIVAGVICPTTAWIWGTCWAVSNLPADPKGLAAWALPSIMLSPLVVALLLLLLFGLVVLVVEGIPGLFSWWRKLPSETQLHIQAAERLRLNRASVIAQSELDIQRLQQYVEKLQKQVD